MTYKLLLIDDEAPKVMAGVFKLLGKDQDYIFDTQTKVSGVPWELVDNADIILIDFSFPDNHTGVEFLRELHKARPSLQMPVVLLSAPNDIKDSEWQECLELGVNDFICKATPPQIVKRKVDSLLEGEAYRRLSEQLKEKLHMEEAKSPVDSLDFGAISSLAPDADEWAYIFRIILKEGPLHRRETYGIFLAILNGLLSQLSERMGKKIEPYPYKTIDGALQESSAPSQRSRKPGGRRVSARSPGNNLADSSRAVPLGIPARLLTEIFQKDRERITEAARNLLTGAPHDVFMNVLLLHICESFRHIIGGGAPHE
jgi:DNA-binding NarL/FixJ family response regulator